MTYKELYNAIMEAFDKKILTSKETDSKCSFLFHVIVTYVHNPNDVVPEYIREMVWSNNNAEIETIPCENPNI